MAEQQMETHMYIKEVFLKRHKYYLSSTSMLHLNSSVRYAVGVPKLFICFTVKKILEIFENHFNAIVT